MSSTTNDTCRCRVTPQHLIARLNGQEVDLCHLYSAVLEMGGSYRVNQQSQWDEIYARLFGSSSDPDRKSVIGVNVSVALRQIYQRYLMPYERVHYSNFAHDVADDDEDDARANFITSMSGSSSSGKDAAASFVIHSSLTQPHPPQKHAHHVDPLTRLFCALVSGLANEMEFGLRVVTMLANSRQIDAIADLKLVDVLLECCSLSLCHCRTSDDQQQQQRHQHQQQSNNRTNPATSSHQQLSEKKCVCQSRFWSKKCKDDSIAALLLDDLPDDCSLVLADDEEERDQKMTEKVKRIADLIRTITESIQEYQEADEDNPGESAPPRLVRFAGLLLSSDDSEFKSLALEIICNINLIGSQSRDEESYATLVNSIICHCIRLVVDDNDVTIVRRSIRTLAHIAALTADEPNNAFEQLIDDSQIVSRMIELLTCQQDVSLLTATLEFCWTISENRPKLLTRNSHRVNQLLKILINLLNCEANSHFTPQALKHVRVRDMRNRSQVRVNQSAVTQPSNAVPQQTVRLAVQPAASSNSSNNNNNLAILSESESFAISWLKGLYESGPRSQSVSISEMYTDYIKTSCKSGRKNVVGAQSFSQIIARTFPSATITSSNVVEGLTARPATPRKAQNQQPQQQLTSPILKAHLCAPPKTSPTSTLTAASLTISSTASTPNCTTPTTTLIKSLLANKLRGNSQTNLLKAESASSDSTCSEVKAAATKTPAEGHPVTSTPVAVSHVLCQNQSVLTSSPQSVLISTPSAGGSGLPGQGPQQFLLVRTIIQPGSNQTSGMRLILPASVISQQRPAAPPAVAVNGNGLSPSPPAPAGHSNDILLKAVLGSGIVSESVSQPADSQKNCVKSSPLLNVLLDKGKFPESSASLTTSTTGGSQTQSHDRVYILTTGSPLKSANHTNDTSSLRNGTVSESSPAVPVKFKPSAAVVVNSHTESTLTNGDISAYHNSEEKKSNAMPITDLSSITDIQKAVDDAPKLISKRPADDTGHQTPSKKSKTAEVGDAVSPKTVTKILPVNGEVRLPPKASPEKVSPDVTRTVPVPAAPNPVPAVVEFVCEWHECKR